MGMSGNLGLDYWANNGGTGESHPPGPHSDLEMEFPCSLGGGKAHPCAHVSLSPRCVHAICLSQGWEELKIDMLRLISVVFPNKLQPLIFLFN